MPPTEIVRSAVSPDDLLLVVRGGRNSLSDMNLERVTSDCWERYRFFGVSVFGAPDDDLVALSASVSQIRRRAELRVARCAQLRASEFEVAATFANPAHFSVVLPNATPATFARLRSCFSEPIPNPGYQPDR
jgi:hypothetical protein